MIAGEGAKLSNGCLQACRSSVVPFVRMFSEEYQESVCVENQNSFLVVV